MTWEQYVIIGCYTGAMFCSVATVYYSLKTRKILKGIKERAK